MKKRTIKEKKRTFAKNIFAFQRSNFSSERDREREREREEMETIFLTSTLFSFPSIEMVSATRKIVIMVSRFCEKEKGKKIAPLAV